MNTLPHDSHGYSRGWTWLLAVALIVPGLLATIGGFICIGLETPGHDEWLDGVAAAFGLMLLASAATFAVPLLLVVMGTMQAGARSWVLVIGFALSAVVGVGWLCACVALLEPWAWDGSVDDLLPIAAGMIDFTIITGAAVMGLTGLVRTIYQRRHVPAQCRRAPQREGMR